MSSADPDKRFSSPDTTISSELNCTFSVCANWSLPRKWKLKYIKLAEFPFTLYCISKQTQISYFISLYISLMHTLKPYLTFFIFSSNYMHRVTISPQFSTAIITILYKDQLKMTWHEKKQTWKNLTFPNPYLCFSTVISWFNKEMLSHLPHNSLVYVVRSSLLQQLSHLVSPLERETLLVLLATGSVLKHCHCLALCHSGCSGNQFERL